MKLTRPQRVRLFAGQAPRISGEGKCPAQRGEVIRLSSLLSLTVIRVRPQKGGKWTLDYEVNDRRDKVRNLRRTPPAHDVTESLPTPETIAQAAEESAYTSAPSSLSDAGEAVDHATQEQFSKEASHKFDAMGRRRAELEVAALSNQLSRAVRRSQETGEDVSSDARVIARRIEAWRRRLGRNAA